ncbi:MAG: hypothetical protein ABSE17_00760 [Candidatus Levyibacteriota bacterium]|jgi:hypothetical protein
MATQEDGQSFAISTSKGQAILSRVGGRWFVEGDSFGADIPCDGTPIEALKAAFGPLEGNVILRTQVPTEKNSGGQA